jgi:hypothetical protein
MIAKASKNKPSHWPMAKILRLTIVAALLAFICQIGLCFVNFAIVAPPSFDGGMNLNVAVSFIQGNGYGFFYDVFYPFPAQTDGPFILPAALILWLGGITPFTTQLVNLLYLAAFTAAVYILLRRLQLAQWMALVGVVLCLRTPGMSEFAINGFGEIPCLIFFLLGLILLSYELQGNKTYNWKILLGGVALGLCAITKTIGLIMVVPTLFAFVVLVLARERRWSRTIYVFSGIMVPVLGWELFRYINVGNGHNYLTWWRLQLGEVLWHAGVSDNITGYINPIVKAKSHLEILAFQIGLPMVLVIALLAIVFVAIVILGLRLWRSRNLGNFLILLTLSMVAGAYFIWWIFLTPSGMAWLRRIMDGLILLQMLSVVVVFTLVREIAASTAKRSLLKGAMIIPVICLIAAAQMMMVWHGGIFTSDPKPTNRDSEQMTAAKILRELPADGKLFGSGWWKAPVLALFSGRQMVNFEHWSPKEINALPRKYLVLDGFAKSLAMEEFQRILDVSTYRVIYDAPHAAIYELLLVQAYKSFQPADRAAPNLASGFDAINCNYQHVRGLYPPEVHHRWSRPEAGFLLQRTSQDRLLLTLTIPDQLFDSHTSPSDLLLSVSSPGCIDKQIPVVRGRQTLEIPVTCPVTTEPAALEIAVRLNAHMPFIRRIELDGRRLGFLFESAQLVDSQSLTAPDRIECIDLNVSYIPPSFTDINWVKGIARAWAAAFFIPAPIKAQTRRDFAVGRKVTFSNGTVRTIVKLEDNAGNLIVHVDGMPLDGNIVGYPQEIKIANNAE